MLLSQVKGKDITELIACGREKLASVPAGGGAVVVAAPAGGAGGGAPALLICMWGYKRAEPN
ncbi:60S acidic ribosomal protein p2 [Phtheirospermum japonicum]|uniref:60S acidic ribosomal protein p2 n=1 Tax=Phtheirospermum japonicum TaxID=374723 RepID=A0A830D736_9LAMI|nr:60S acidic ribosomal protein p2 [Phtheirospermum japonicum]